MNSSTSNSKLRWTSFPFQVFLGVNLVLGAAILLVPWKGAGWFQGEAIRLMSEKRADILLMGDSKIQPFVEGYVDCPFFKQPTFALTMDSATVLYQRIFYNRIVSETSLRPKVVFLSVGANNFNEMGLHIMRDYAIRHVAGWKDLAGYTGMPGSAPFLFDALLSRLYPAYGYRIEITHLMWRSWKPRTIEMTPPPRDPVADENYLLIYKRGVLADFKLSKFHMNNLEVLCGEVRAHGGEPVIIELPVEPSMRALEKERCGDWDRAITELAQRAGVQYLDLRDVHDLSFRDLNHLSNPGAKDAVNRWLEPLADEILQKGAVAAR